MQKVVELQEKLIEVKRVAKVVTGGRIFAFTALVVVGDGNGRVGFGHAKAKEVPLAVSKARLIASKNMITVNVDKRNGSLYYGLKESFGATNLIMSPASVGTGVIAATPAKAVLELAGFKNVLTKIYGSRNHMNVIRAIFKALSVVKTPYDVSKKRGMSVQQVFMGV